MRAGQVVTTTDSVFVDGRSRVGALDEVDIAALAVKISEGALYPSLTVTGSGRIGPLTADPPIAFASTLLLSSGGSCENACQQL